MSSNLSYPTTEILLELLKAQTKEHLVSHKGAIETVKIGLIDERDELPMLAILPQLELVDAMYNDGLISIARTFRFDIINKAYKIDEVKDSLKSRLTILKDMFYAKDRNWELVDDAGDFAVYDFSLDLESFEEPINNANRYIQSCTLPITLRSYYKIKQLENVVDTIGIENYTDLLDHIYGEAKNKFSAFNSYWRDVAKPQTFHNFPAFGVFFELSEDDKNRQTSTIFSDITIVFRIYSSLATREIAFVNHLRNIETVKSWILSNPTLGGRVDSLQLTSIDYGIDTYQKPYEGGMSDEPVFRSDIATTCSLIQTN